MEDDDENEEYTRELGGSYSMHSYFKFPKKQNLKKKKILKKKKKKVMIWFLLSVEVRFLLKCTPLLLTGCSYSHIQ